MSVEQITEFFMWLTIINVGLFMVNSVLILLMRKWICKMHGKMFGIAKENVSIVLYGWLGIYKIMILVFCIAPYAALCIVCR